MALKEEAIVAIYTSLVEKIETRSVSCKLFELGVISQDSRQDILSRSTDNAKNMLLVDKVLRSDHPEAFDRFLQALEKPNPFLKQKLEDKLTEQCVIHLIDEIVSTNQAKTSHAEEHDEGSDNETKVKRVSSEPASNSMTQSVDGATARSRQSFPFPSGNHVIRRHHPKLSKIEKQAAMDVVSEHRKSRTRDTPKLSKDERQEAFDRVSARRESRGFSPLDQTDVTRLIEDLTVELHVTMRVSSSHDRRKQAMDSTGSSTSGYDSSTDPRKSTEV